MYKDEYFTKNTWIWDGKPHWAYNTDAISYQDARDAIEWTPNVINASAAITGNDATIRLSSFTPNLKEYQVKKEGEWMKCDSVVDVELAKDREEIAFRVLNKACKFCCCHFQLHSFDPCRQCKQSKERLSW